MKKSIIITAVLVFLATSFFAQRRDNFNSNQDYAKNITFSFGRANLTHGINYDMRLKRGQQNGFGFEVGIGGISMRRPFRWNTHTDNLFTTPIELNYIVGKKRNGLIAGIGVLPAFASSEGALLNIDNELLDLKGIDFIGSFATLGYRYQALNNGLSFQVSYDLVITRAGALEPALNLSIGFAFK